MAVFAHRTGRAGPGRRSGFPSAEASPVLSPSLPPWFTLLPAGADR